MDLNAHLRVWFILIAAGLLGEAIFLMLEYAPWLFAVIFGILVYIGAYFLVRDMGRDLHE